MIEGTRPTEVSGAQRAGFARRRIELASIVLAIGLLSAVHFAVAVANHELHEVHVVFRGLYLVPIVAGAVWFGLAGGLVSSLVVSVLFSLHVAVSWPADPWLRTEQAAMIAVYLAVGALSGLLVRRQERERSRRLAAERAAEREALLQAVEGLASALGFRDEYTREHSEMVAGVAVEIGRRQGLPPERLERLRLAARMHDIGKIGVRDDILFKPEELTREELQLIERHPEIAAAILRATRADAIAEIVLSHHECPDGSGYPRGLSAGEIPLEARILRVADVLGALTDRRSYKRAMSAEEALSLMREMGEGKLDAQSLATLVALVEQNRGAREDPPATGSGAGARD